MSSKLQAISGYWVRVVAHSLGLATLAALSQPFKSEAQVIPAFDGTGSQVRINGNQIHIYGGSLSSDEANLFHSLQQFGLTEDQIANFLAKPNLENIVTRITGGDQSVINGVLQVTGGNANLYLMNPSGMIFGANAQLNLPASFVATTANGIQFGNQWFSATGANGYDNLLGNPTAFSFDANAGAIINSGNLMINPQQSLLLLGGSVVNTGQLSAREGQVLVTAIPDRNVLHLQVPGNILTLEVEIPDELTTQPHAWTLPIASLPELLTSEAVNPESLGLSLTDAGDVQLAGSNLQIPDQAGTAIVSGAIDVSGDRGGSVGVFGDLVGVADAQIDVSGTFGGGTVLIGGEYQGQGTVPTAERTYIDGNSSISADALTSGDGGRVIVWADDATAFYGEITARGGAHSGNGGFAEVSGRESLIFDGMADLSSISGAAGTLLLDPENIFIRCSNPDPNICSNPATGAPNTITQETLESISGNSNIFLEASRNIIIESLNIKTDQNGISLPTLSFQVGNGDITFVAGGDFTMPTNSALIAPSTQPSTTLDSGRTLTIQATNVTLGDISMRSGIPLNPTTGETGAPGGNVIIRATGSVTTGDIATFADSDIRDIDNDGIAEVVTDNFFNGGNITITGVNGNIPDTIDTSRGILASGTSQGDGGDIFLEAEGDIITASISSSPVALGNNRAGDITITSQTGNIDTSRVAPNIINPDKDEQSLISAGGAAAAAGTVQITAPLGEVTLPGISTRAQENGGSITVDSPSIILRNEQTDSINLNTGTNSGENGGNINIIGNISEVSGRNFGLNIDLGDGSIQFQGSIDVGSLNFLSANSIQLGDDLTTETNGANLLFNSPLILTNPISITTNSGAVTFNSTVNSETNETNNLTLVTGAGNIAISNALGSIQPLGDITLNSSGSFSLRDTASVTANSLTGDSQTANLSGSITTTGAEGINLSTTGNLTATDLSTNGNTTLSSGGNLTATSLDVVGDTNLSSSRRLIADGLTTEGTTNLSSTGNLTATDLNTTGNTTLTSDGSVSITNITANAGNFSATAGNAMTASNITNNGGGISLTSQTITSPIRSLTATGDIGINVRNDDLQVTRITSTGGSVTATANNGTAQLTNVSGQTGVTTIANGNVNATAIVSAVGNVTVNSQSGSSEVNNVTAREAISVEASDDVTAINLTSTGNGINLTSQNGDAQVNNLTSNADVTVTALGTITSTNGITSNGGGITLNSPTRIETDELVSDGGNISLSNSGNSTGLVIVNGDIDASGAVNGGDVEIISDAAINLSSTNINTNGGTGTGGDITLQSIDGRIAVNNLTATGRTGGGNVSIIASEFEDLAITLSIGEIDTSASIGNGGDVLLDPFGKIQVSFINAQGGTNGIGGDVTAITTGGLFRAIDSFVDQNGIDASISAAGGAGEGSISIFHNGGDLFVPFFVAFDDDEIDVNILADNASGTVGALTTGDPAVNEDNIIENRVFPGTFVQDRIGIFTSDRFTLALDNALPDAEPDDPQLENADEQPFWLDEYFTRRTEAYLGLGFNTDVKSLEEIQEDLRLIEDATGVKPALIYAVFEPEEVLQTIAEGGPGNPDDLVNQGWLQRFREIGSDRLQLVLVTSEGQPIFRRPNDEEATRRQITGRPKEDSNPLTSTVLLLNEGIQRDVEEMRQDGESKPDRYLPYAQRLYNLLVLPLEEDLRTLEIENLVFILDTGLRSTPMAAMSSMHDGNTYIIENYSVGLMPSFSITDTRYNDIRNSEVLAMGMSDFSQQPRFEDSPLEAVPYETTIITQQLWESSLPENKPLLEDSFTVARYIESQEDYPSGIVHLATHAVFNTASPNESLIQFSDRELKFSEFDSLNLYRSPIELLVLSACKTAFDAENDNAELGFAGLAIQAGVKSALASIWDVNDIGTFALMLEFYTQLDRHTTKAAALQEAQQAMMRGEVYFENNTVNWTDNVEMVNLDLPQNLDLRHPYYWAGFTLVGNPW